MRVVIAGAGSVGRSIARELLGQRAPGAAHRQGRRRRPGLTRARGVRGCSRDACELAALEEARLEESDVVRRRHR